MNASRSPWQTPLAAGGAACIVLLVALPGARAVLVNGLRLWNEREWTFLTSPALYLWGLLSVFAVVLPLGIAAQLMPLIRAEDALPRVLTALVISRIVMSVALALLLHGGAWASYPILKDGQLRFVPLFPWPDWRFWSDYLTPRL